MRRVLVALILILVSGCTVYKSSDRDDFNSNGKARAPAQKASHPEASSSPSPSVGTPSVASVQLTYDDQDLLANPCSAFNSLNQQDIESMFGRPARLSMTNQISRRTSTCLITNQAPSDDLSSVSLLACSWKPVDGQPIRVSHRQPIRVSHRQPIAVQTTEDDLRDSGFSVVTTSVVGGERLRMNCEAYAPTNVFAQDLNSGARETDQLSATFAAFAQQLKLSTLSSDGAR